MTKREIERRLNGDNLVQVMTESEENWCSIDNMIAAIMRREEADDR